MPAATTKEKQHLAPRVSLEWLAAVVTILAIVLAAAIGFGDRVFFPLSRGEALETQSNANREMLRLIHEDVREIRKAVLNP